MFWSRTLNDYLALTPKFAKFDLSASYKQKLRSSPCNKCLQVPRHPVKQYAADLRSIEYLPDIFRFPHF